MHSSSAGLKPRDRSLSPFFHQISPQPSRFSMRRVVGEEVSLPMPASVNDDKCEGDSKYINELRFYRGSRENYSC